MKIKHALLFTLLFTISNFSFAQKYMDDIAQTACECFEKLPDTLTTKEYEMKLGFCLLEAASPYQKQLKKDYKINFAKIDTEGEELGRIIGLKMATICPDAFLKIMGETDFEEVEENNTTENIVTGKIIQISDDAFVVFSVKDEKGKISKFYWFTFIESNIELSTKYKTLADKKVIITYTTQEFFDTKLGEYRNFKIIQKLDVID